MQTQRCPDCNGTGKYVGFQTEEICQLCGGVVVLNDGQSVRLPNGLLPPGIISGGRLHSHSLSETEIKEASREMIGQNYGGSKLWIPHETGHFEAGS